MKPTAFSLARIIVVAAAVSATFAVAQTANRDAPSSPPSKSAPPAKAAPPAPAAAQGQGAGTGVQQCIACHGERGEGNAQGGYPRIAGQSQAYLQHQLESYANGTRRNPVMEPIAKGLSPQARTAAAAYYAGLQPPTRAGSTTGAQANARGEELATRGDDRKQVPACGNCHGPGGIGEPPEIPYLAGLDSAYLTAALNAFKSGARRNDAGAQMRAVVRGMAAEDIAAVAQYFAGLAPPARPAPENIVRAAGAATAGAAPRGPATGGARSTTSTTSSAGSAGAVGSEQGAGTTGGAQGAGGQDQSSTTRQSNPAPQR